MNPELTLSGNKQLIGRLETLGDRVQRKVVRKAVRAGAGIQRKAMKAGAPVLSGSLKKALASKFKVYKGAYIAVTGARADYTAVVNGKTIRPNKYLHLVEFGDKDTPPNGFMRRAFESTRGAVNTEMTTKLGSEIEVEASK